MLSGSSVKGRELGQKRTATREQIEVLRLVGQGARVYQAAHQLGIHPKAAHDRLARLRRIAERRTLYGLVYWGLTHRYFDLPYLYLRREVEPPTAIRVAIVDLLAKDYTHREIARKLNKTIHQVENNIWRAREAVNSPTQANLVGIFWTEGWIA